MPILNYTTKVAASKTVAQIQALLGQSGAKAVMVCYSDNGDVESLAFKIDHNNVPIQFNLPAKVDNIHKILWDDPKVPPRLESKEQAERVAWRIIKDWVEAQFALIESDQATMIEVFLPYAQNPVTGKTLYESLSSTGFKQLGYDN